ncbi:MAG: hypothetical protein VYA30_15170 [Myxococcota bacterium]|nr:hypothetical protein [Myxococcota bacterium]
MIQLWLSSCQSDDSPKAQSQLQRYYDTLIADVATWGYSGGEWTEDFGDGAAFGAMYFANVAATDGGDQALAYATETRSYNLSVVKQAGADLGWALENLEEVFMASQGLLEYAGLFEDEEAVQALDVLIDNVMDPVVIGFGNYVDASLGDFAADLYGPTSITAGLVVIYTQYALRLQTPQRTKRIERAVEILDVIHEQAWDDEGSRYVFRPGTERLFLYPNGTMLIALNRVYQLTGQARFLERAKATFNGIQPLRKETGYYQSPYSQEYQGAMTDEYGTLSAQNYLTIGLMLMHQNTGDTAYLTEALTLISFVQQHLYDAAERKLLHHWIDGRAALETDPDYFCSGCNLQVLYIIWYLQNEIGYDLNSA